MQTVGVSLSHWCSPPPQSCWANSGICLGYASVSGIVLLLIMHSTPDRCPTDSEVASELRLHPDILWRQGTLVDSRNPQCGVKEVRGKGGWMVVRDCCGKVVRGGSVLVWEYEGLINHVINVVDRESGGRANGSVILGRRVVLVMVCGR